MRFDVSAVDLIGFKTPMQPALRQQLVKFETVGFMASWTDVENWNPADGGQLFVTKRWVFG